MLFPLRAHLLRGTAVDVRDIPALEAGIGVDLRAVMDFVLQAPFDVAQGRHHEDAPTRRARLDGTSSEVYKQVILLDRARFRSLRETGIGRILT